MFLKTFQYERAMWPHEACMRSGRADRTHGWKHSECGEYSTRM